MRSTIVLLGLATGLVLPAGAAWAEACPPPTVCVKGNIRYRFDVAPDGTLGPVRMVAVSPQQQLQSWAQCVALRWPETEFAAQAPTAPGVQVKTIRLESPTCARPAE